MIKLKEGSLADKFNEYATYVLKEGYVYDSENKDAVKTCIDVFEKNEIGLIVVGNSGSGKTLFFDIMQKILPPKDSRMFVKVDVLKVVLQFNNKDIGHGVFRQWEKNNVLFDDLGTEKMGILFADKVEVFENFIQFRYNLFKTLNLKTHYTTNLSKKELNDRYGIRCTSRLNEMCERVLLGGNADYTDRRTYRNFISLPQVHHPVVLTKEEIAFNERYRLAKENAQNAPPVENKSGLGERLRKRLG